jgi:hypothetical protein
MSAPFVPLDLTPEPTPAQTLSIVTLKLACEKQKQEAERKAREAEKRNGHSRN